MDFGVVVCKHPYWHNPIAPMFSISRRCSTMKRFVLGFALSLLAFTVSVGAQDNSPSGGDSSAVGSTVRD